MNYSKFKKVKESKVHVDTGEHAFRIFCQWLYRYYGCYWDEVSDAIDLSTISKLTITHNDFFGRTSKTKTIRYRIRNDVYFHFSRLALVNSWASRKFRPIYQNRYKRERDDYFYEGFLKALVDMWKSTVMYDYDDGYYINDSLKRLKKKCMDKRNDSDIVATKFWSTFMHLFLVNDKLTQLGYILCLYIGDSQETLYHHHRNCDKYDSFDYYASCSCFTDDHTHRNVSYEKIKPKLRKLKSVMEKKGWKLQYYKELSNYSLKYEHKCKIVDPVEADFICDKYDELAIDYLDNNYRLRVPPVS